MMRRDGEKGKEGDECLFLFLTCFVWLCGLVLASGRINERKGRREDRRGRMRGWLE
jgi:chloramphenicol 3-O-phosphotransferase